MRKFELISPNQWNIDIETSLLEAESKGYQMPKRGTKYSAGYDFFSPISIVVPSHGMAKIPTGIKATFNEDETLLILPRSGMGFKTGIRLANTVGVIDSDYLNNGENEGHIFVKFYNHTDNDYKINMGDKMAQGIFMKYLTVDDEDEISNVRLSGLGSTGK